MSSTTPAPDDLSQPARPASSFLGNELTAWVVLGLMLVMTVLVWHTSETHVERRAQERFVYQVDQETKALENHLQSYIQLLRGSAALFEATNQKVTRSMWQRYIRQLHSEKLLEGMPGIGFIEMVNPADKAAHEQRIRAEGFPNYQILPEGPRQQYSSIIWLEPANTRNQQAIGYDTYSDSVRRQAMDRARDTGQPAVTGKIALFQDKHAQPGFAIYLPVYRTGYTPETEAERRAALLGFVYSPFRVNDLMRQLFASHRQDMEIELYDAEISPTSLMYDSYETPLEQTPRYMLERKLLIGGHYWTLHFFSTPAFESIAHSNQPQLFAIGSLVVDLLLFLILMLIARHRKATERATQEFREAEAEIRSLAFYDPLTSLPNRRMLLDELHKSVSRNAQKQQFGALLFLDLDNFKTLNDSLGHEIGDQLLIQVAQRLRSNLRDDDIVARLGGDEFVMIIDGLAAEADEAHSIAKSIATKLISAISTLYRLGEHECRCTGSIGITLFSEKGTRIDELLRQADLAMYQAKDAGRNSIRFFEQVMQADITARSRMEHELYQALEAEHFRLYFQPQLDRDGRTVGVEALIRWVHPEKGFVSPGEFIPLAEDTGLILPIGHWVLREACARLVAWKNQPDACNLTIAVNVSAQQFRLPFFVEELISLIEYTGANPRHLKLEITESMLLSDLDEAIRKMTALRNFGISFSLDDFGTGYSSLAYLKRLPLNQIKIDQSFVRDVLLDPNDAAICRAVIALSKSLGLQVIAEGVEQQEQWQFLMTEGCDQAQGYLYAKPLPETDLLAWLEQRQTG